jgi:drug/metabolite transporter (DMT)-like permease
MSKRTLAELLLVVVTFIWGSTFVIVKGALEDASPLPFVSLRFTVAGLLLLWVLARGRVDPKALVPSLVLGTFLFGGYVFQTWGLLYTSPSKCAFITGFSVILVPVILTLYGFRLRRASIAGAILGLAGIYLLVLPTGFAGVNRGDLLTLVGAASFAVHIVLVGRYAQRHSFLQLAPVQILVVGVLATAAQPFDSDRMLHWTTGLVVAVLITAVLATGFAFSVQNWAQQYTPAAHTALIFALEPVFAAVTSWFALGERPGGKVVLGSLLILGGIAVSEALGGSAPSPVEG